MHSPIQSHPSHNTAQLYPSCFQQFKKPLLIALEIIFGIVATGGGVYFAHFYGINSIVILGGIAFGGVLLTVIIAGAMGCCMKDRSFPQSVSQRTESPFRNPNESSDANRPTSFHDLHQDSQNVSEAPAQDQDFLLPELDLLSQEEYEDLVKKTLVLLGLEFERAVRQSSVEKEKSLEFMKKNSQTLIDDKKYEELPSNLQLELIRANIRSFNKLLPEGEIQKWIELLVPISKSFFNIDSKDQVIFIRILEVLTSKSNTPKLNHQATVNLSEIIELLFIRAKPMTQVSLYIIMKRISDDKAQGMVDSLDKDQYNALHNAYIPSFLPPQTDAAFVEGGS